MKRSPDQEFCVPLSGAGAASVNDLDPRTDSDRWPIDLELIEPIKPRSRRFDLKLLSSSSENLLENEGAPKPLVLRCRRNIYVETRYRIPIV